MKFELSPSISYIDKSDHKTLIIQESTDKFYILETAETQVFNFLLSKGICFDFEKSFPDLSADSISAFVKSLIDNNILIPIDHA